MSVIIEPLTKQIFNGFYSFITKPASAQAIGGRTGEGGAFEIGYEPDLKRDFKSSNQLFPPWWASVQCYKCARTASLYYI